MTDELRSLYEEVILDHNKNPRNFEKIPQESNHFAHGDNPLCGDRYSVYLSVKDNIIKDVGFDGAGCAISKASASLMLESVKGKTIEEARELFQKTHNFFTLDPNIAEKEGEDLGKIEVLAGVKKFPMRVKCATLCWHIMNSALANEKQIISTE